MSGRTKHLPDGEFKIELDKKICCKCKVPQPISEFPRRIECADGVGSLCNTCQKEYQAAARARRKEWNLF